MIKYMRAYHLYTLISVNDKVKIKHVKDWKCDKFGDNGLIIEIDYDDYNIDKYFIDFTHEERKLTSILKRRIILQKNIRKGERKMANYGTYKYHINEARNSKKEYKWIEDSAKLELTTDKITRLYELKNAIEYNENKAKDIRKEINKLIEERNKIEEEMSKYIRSFYENFLKTDETVLEYNKKISDKVNEIKKLEGDDEE